MPFLLSNTVNLHWLRYYFPLNSGVKKYLRSVVLSPLNQGSTTSIGVVSIDRHIPKPGLVGKVGASADAIGLLVAHAQRLRHKDAPNPKRRFMI